MMQFLIYDLRVAILIAVFYMFYRLLLSHETFHRVNRMVLLFTSLASFVLPLCIITMHRTVVLETIAEPNMEDGTISKAKVANKVDELLHAEAIRVVEAMPKWTPGKQNGKEVRVKYTLPVTFRLN